MTLNDLHEHRVQTGLTKLKAGSTEVDNAIALARAKTFSLPGEPERRAREGLKTPCSAVHWLEGTDYFDRAHHALDQAGRGIRLCFGCQLSFDWSEGYSQTCPVAVAHNSIGVSVVAVVEESNCSICRRDPEDDECTHITGQLYGDEMCLEIIRKAKLKELAIVSRPNFPDARLTMPSVSTAALKRELGRSFRYGMRVSCDRCLQKCGGISELPFSGHA